MRKSEPLIMLTALIMTVFVLSAGPAAAQGDPVHNLIPGDCPYQDGAYYQEGLFPASRPAENRILLRNWFTGEIVVELESFGQANLLSLRGWSPDCHYIFYNLVLPADHPSERRRALVAWDAVTGQKLGEYPYRTGLWWAVWDPTVSHALIGNDSAWILWSFPDGHPTRIDGFWQNDRASDLRLAWDTARGQVLLVNETPGAAPGVTTYDLDTAQPVTFYPTPGGATQTFFALSRAGDHVAVWTYGQPGTLDVYHRDSGQLTRLDLDALDTSLLREFDVSEDGRFLAGRIDGPRNLIVVWGLGSLPADPADRDPIYELAAPRGVDWTFEGPDALRIDGRRLDLNSGTFMD